jgi:hypothetical protein
MVKRLEKFNCENILCTRQFLGKNANNRQLFDLAIKTTIILFAKTEERSFYMINELEVTLKQSLSWNKPTTTCLVQILMAVITLRTVNLKKLACGIKGEASLESQYRRLQRFFAKVTFPAHVLAKLLAGLFFSPGEAFYLSMDRTNWQWGRSNLNFLVLSACYKGVAIPLYWVALDKKGNSDTAERIVLVNRFISGFGRKKIAGLLADREFVGNQWLAYLIESQIPFDLRMKKNYITTNARGVSVRVDGLFSYLKPGEAAVLVGKRKMMGQTVFLSALRLSDGDLLILATDQAPETSIKRYGYRWEIETLFSCLKGRGFNFEDTRLTDLKRIEALFGVLALALAWSHKVGDWRHENHKPIAVKKHGRLAISYFRYGLDWISQALLDVNRRLKQLNESIMLFINNLPVVHLAPESSHNLNLC